MTKVLVDSRQGSNLLYLPLDKIMQSAGATPQAAQDAATRAQVQTNTPNVLGIPATNTTDARARDFSRSRERESR